MSHTDDRMHGCCQGAPLHETFCVFPPAGGDQVGEAVDRPGARATIRIRAPPTMACGTIRRVVLENEKYKNQKQPTRHAASILGGEVGVGLPLAM